MNLFKYKKIYVYAICIIAAVLTYYFLFVDREQWYQVKKVDDGSIIYIDKFNIVEHGNTVQYVRKRTVNSKDIISLMEYNTNDKTIRTLQISTYEDGKLLEKQLLNENYKPIDPNSELWGEIYPVLLIINLRKH